MISDGGGGAEAEPSSELVPIRAILEANVAPLAVADSEIVGVGDGEVWRHAAHEEVCGFLAVVAKVKGLYHLRSAACQGGVERARLFGQVHLPDAFAPEHEGTAPEEAAIERLLEDAGGRADCLVLARGVSDAASPIVGVGNVLGIALVVETLGALAGFAVACEYGASAGSDAFCNGAAELAYDEVYGGW